MADTEKRKIVRRSAEERIAEIDAKIAGCKTAIAKQEEKISVLEQKKQAILNPVPRISKAGQLKELMNKAKESGMTNEEIAEKLGIKID